MIPPAFLLGFEPGSPKFFACPAAIRRRVFFFTAALALLVSGCTSEPLISRKGISSTALGELGLETLSVGGESLIQPPSLEMEDVNYIGGVIPVKRSTSRSADFIDNGTRFFVDGHKRGMVPWVGTLRQPGPHQVRLEFPAFEPYTLTLGDPFLLHTAHGYLEAWPPIIVHMLTGEIFTTQEISAVDVDRNSGTTRKTDIAKKVGRDPLLIVTTTTKAHPGWRKIGQMRVQGQAAGSGNTDHVR